MTVPDATAVATKMEVNAKALISTRLSIAPENADSIATALLLQQLEGSEVNLQRAQREAKEAAALAQRKHQELIVTQEAQRVLLDRAKVLANPLRTVTATSMDALSKKSQDVLERRKLMLTSMLNELRVELKNKDRKKVSQLLKQIQDYRATLTETQALSDLLKDSENLRGEAEVFLAARGVSKVAVPLTEEVEERNIDNDLEDLGLALDVLDADLEDGNATAVRESLAGVEEAMQDVDLAVLQQDEELWPLYQSLMAQADEMLAKDMGEGAAKKADQEGTGHHRKWHRRHATRRGRR
jgi:hypothetical protein